MPITQSAKKALRQSATRKAKNREKKDDIRNVVKEIKKILASGKTEDAFKLVPKAYKAIDKAAKTGVIKKNSANRKKSGVLKLIKKGPVISSK